MADKPEAPTESAPVSNADLVAQYQAEKDPQKRKQLWEQSPYLQSIISGVNH